MKPIVIFIFLLSSSLQIGLALKCLQCHKKNNDTCDEVSVECPNSANCMVISEFYEAYGDVYHSIKKDCSSGSPCNTSIYLSNFGDKKMRVSVQCCAEDDCNRGNYHMPPEQTEHNGRNCPSCFGVGIKECISNRTVKCLKEEDECVNYIGRLKDPGNNIKEHSVKGCLSPFGCIYKFGASISVQEIYTDTFECSV